MNDLISRQAAIELIHSLYPSPPIMRRNRERWEKKYKPYIEAEKALEQLPSAQPEIIYCKDCIKREICRTSTTWAVAPKDDWYCADAERGTDAEKRKG